MISLKTIKRLTLLFLVFLLGIWCSPYYKGLSVESLASNKTNPLKTSKNIKSALLVQNALRDIYKQVNPSVVRIETEQYIKVQNVPLLNDPLFRYFFGDQVPRQNSPQKQKRKKQGLGSGFILDQSGFIATNYHVVAPNGQKVDKINVKLINGSTYEAKLVGYDPHADLAVLKINASNLKASYIGDSDKVEVGDIAIAIGNPFGLSATFTMGVISSKGQDIRTEDGVSRIQTDAAINPGNSGGPLLNIKGEVIGINQMIYSKSGGSVGIGFAIPINYAMSIIEHLKKGEKVKRGYIGVSIRSELSKQEFEQLNLQNKKGLLISEVQLGSPAWKSGLRPYDFIVKINNAPITEFSQLKSLIIRKGPEKKLTVTFIRDRQEKTITLTIGELPNNQQK